MSKFVYRILFFISFIAFITKGVYAQVSYDTLDQNADQKRGNYAATNLDYLGALGMMQNAWKDPLKHMGEGQSRPGYSKYYWSPDLVLPVRTREGMYTLINFPNWELIEDIVWGDAGSFEVRTEGPSSILITPKGSSLGVDTNMIVIGRSGNKYAFYVQSETVNSDRISNSIIDIEVINKKNSMNSQNSNVNKGFVYADAYGNGSNSGIAGEGGNISSYTRNMQREDWIQHIPVDPTQFRFDIEVYVPNPDDIIIAPERVWRDNIFTYIDLGEKALTSIQRPIVTLIVERSETPVGFRAAGPNNRLIIVEAMGDMVLRSGKRLVCLKLRRADSDGLENTVYANTNDWDVQFQTNGQSNENLGSMDNDALYEDVFNDSAEKNINSSNNVDIDSFFNLNSFAGENVNSTERRENNNTESNKSGTNTFNQKLDALPKVTPIVAKTSDKVSDKGNSSPQNTSQNSEILAPKQKDVKVSEENISKKINDNKVNEEYKSEDDIIAEAMREVMSKEKNAQAKVGTYKADKKLAKTTMSPEASALVQEVRSGKTYSKKTTNTVLELGTDEDVNNLEKLWSDISKRYSATLGKYEPYYSIDTPADGQGKETFHLRAGPIKNLEEGDNVCTQLGRNGIFCSVVRIE